MNAASYPRFASRAAILNFEVPRCQIIAEITAEIPLLAMLKMKVSYLLDILVGGVCNIGELPVGEVGKKVPMPIGLPPVLGCLGCLWWHGDSVGVCLCVVVCGWDRWAWKK